MFLTGIIRHKREEDFEAKPGVEPVEAENTGATWSSTSKVQENKKRRHQAKDQFKRGFRD